MWSLIFNSDQNQNPFCTFATMYGMIGGMGMRMGMMGGMGMMGMSMGVSRRRTRAW